MKKYKFLVFIFFLLVDAAFAHTLSPSPIDYSDNLTDAMCKKTEYIKQKNKEVRDIYNKINDKQNNLKNLLENMKNEENEREIEVLRKDLIQKFSPIFNQYFKIQRHLVYASDDACMGDDGYHFIKTNNKELKKDIDQYNNYVVEYNVYLYSDFLTNVKTIIQKYEK